MRLVLLIFLFITLADLGHAQNITDVLQNYQKFNPKDSNKLFIRVEYLNFFKNNEYKSANTAGYTLLGAFIRPQLSYYYDRKIRFSIGINLLKYSGQDNFKEITPYLSAIYSPNKTHTLIFGNLNNDRNHGLLDYANLTEKYYTSPPETGFQYILNSERLYLDTWINWEKFIEKDDPFQEEFTYGFFTKTKLFKFNEYSNLYMPINGLFKHTGGEIDTSDKAVSTIYYLASGVEFKQNYEQEAIITDFSIGIHYIMFSKTLRKNENEPKITSNFYSNSTLQTRYGNLTLGYCLFDNYFNPNGLDIFWSVSSFDPDYHQKIRRLGIIKYSFKYNIDSEILIGGGIDNYLDINERKNNFSTSIFLVINSNFFIKKYKK